MLWRAPIEVFVFYLPKIVVSILLGSFVFLTKRNWWTILLLLVIDLWCIANLMYNNANDLLLDIPAIQLANNLKGFESSLSAFFNLNYLCFPILTLIYAVFIVIIRQSKKVSIPNFMVCIAIVILSNIGMCIPDWLSYYHNKKDADFDMANGRKIIIDLYGKNGWHCFIPFHEVKMDALPDLTYFPDYGNYYVYQNSILHYAIAMCVYHANTMQQGAPEICVEELRESIDKNNRGEPLPNQNLIIILVESLESWPFEMGELSWQVAPHLMDMLHQQKTVAFNTIRSEAKHGVSGDGQMLVSTGILPIYAGSACVIYGNNEWPSYISLYPHSVFIDCSNGVWNQRTMSMKYGYKVDSYDTNCRTDKDVFLLLNDIFDTIPSPYMTMALTSAMHSPFAKHNGYQLTVSDDMPKFMVEYLEGLHYTDSCFGIFWKQYKNHTQKNTTIIVTGDHTVFKPAMLKEFHNYAIKHDMNISENESFCPLIIHSAAIENRYIGNDLCYQMDIYPTIMHLIGCEDYYWKGFGVNLLDSATRYNRPFTEQEAYELSDKLIRSNYFATLKQGAEVK